MPIDVDAEVLANTHLSPEYHVLVLGAPDLARVAQPGQFVMVRTSPGVTPLLRRPFSIFERLCDGDGRPAAISLFSRVVGEGSRLLYEARIGQRIPTLGPLGHPFSLVAPPAPAWLVAGGVGLAPLAMLAETLAARGVQVRVFYGARTSTELFCLDRFDRPGIDLVLATEDGTRGTRGLVTVPLAAALNERNGSAVPMIYACGPELMLKAVSMLASEHGCPSQLAMERKMGCGMGGCYSCVVRVRDAEGGWRYIRSCLDGPIFRGDQIIWE